MSTATILNRQQYKGWCTWRLRTICPSSVNKRSYVPGIKEPRCWLVERTCTKIYIQRATRTAGNTQYCGHACTAASADALSRHPTSTIVREELCTLNSSRRSSCVSTRLFKFLMMPTVDMPLTPQLKPSRFFDLLQILPDRKRPISDLTFFVFDLA